MVLGARVGIKTESWEKQMTLSEHMRMRAESAAIFLDKISNPTNLIIAGGPSFHIRYPLRLDQPLIKPPDFSERATKMASRLPSEAAVISMWLNGQGVPFDKMTLEQRSRTTTENAIEVAKIINDLGGGQAGILSMVFHLNRPRENAMEVFRQEFARYGLAEPVPIYTEEIIHKYGSWWKLKKALSEFHQKPYSGFLWSFDEIWARLERGESLVGLRPIKES